MTLRSALPALLLPDLLLLGLAACHPAAREGAPPVSSSIALTSDDRALWVVSPDADSVSVIDPASRTLIAEIPLGTAPPAVDPGTQRYEPKVTPRALAILPGDEKVYVAAESANEVIVVDARHRAILSRIPVGAEPVSVVAAPDGEAVYAVSFQAGTVTWIDPRRDAVVATLPVGEHPWGASLSADGRSLYVTRFLRDPGVTVIDVPRFAVRNQVALAEQPPAAGGKLVPNGVARGLYAAVPRPGTGEVWVPHVLLAVLTAEPSLDFESTVFPTISTLAPGATAEGRRLLFKPLAVPGATGAFNDVISGPRALAFTPDGRTALLASSGSEDVMVFDAELGDEIALVRPLPATMLEGIAVDHAGRHAYLDGRNSHDVVVLTITPGDARSAAPVEVSLAGDPIERLGHDPMPETLRLGQRMFYTANSAEVPITQNFWVSCSSCHLEGGTDAVTWRFTAGPRDTPSNAGGPINTGFLLRQALRNSVADYDVTIDVEQGGRFHRSASSQKPLLDALAAYVNNAIPFPQNPDRAADGALSPAEARGQATFQARCASCHPGPFLTDSGAGNPTLDLAGPIQLHDVGTCVQGTSFDDQAAPDEILGKMHAACDFDTPTLRGVFATPPYFHDGSAATLEDVVDRLPSSRALSAAEKADLVQFLKTL